MLEDLRGAGVQIREGQREPRCLLKTPPYLRTGLMATCVVEELCRMKPFIGLSLSLTSTYSSAERSAF